MGIVYSSVVDAPPREVFDWHARPGALARLSPPFQPVEIVQEATSLRDGTAILRLPGGLRWIARHQAGKYRPPEVFEDHLEGPLSLALSWRHRHEYAAEGPARTRVTDRVDTPVPKFLLRPMFSYRHRQLAADLATHAALRSRPLTIAVTGARSKVGTSFTALLTTGGHRVIRLDEHLWRTEGVLDGADGIVHLADHQARRPEQTRKLVQLAESSGVRCFVDASWLDSGSELAESPSVRVVSVRNGSLRGGPTWIALDDLCDVYLRALVDEDLSGPVAAVAPESPVVQPEVLQARGHRFRYPTRAAYRAHVTMW